MILAVTLNPAIDFTVFGDSFKTGTTNRGQDTFPDAGGKGNNAARIARLLGSDVMVTGFLGGFTGDFIISALEREGIRTAFYRTEKLTRITLAYIDRKTGDETKIVPFGPRITAEESEGFVKHFERLITDNGFSIIGLCGSLAAGLDENYYGMLIDIAKRHSVPVVLDTSGQALMEGVKAGPFLVKPNTEEAMELTGESDKDQVVAKLAGFAGDANIIALTMGKEGALFITGGETVRIVSRKTKTVNPVGAGDAFIGGFLAAYDRFAYDKDRLFSWAVAAGSCTAASERLLWSRSLFEETLGALETIR